MICFLYRHFDKEGALLYVGVSLNHLNRLSQHKEASHWFAEIAMVKVEQFPDRSAALAAERAAITGENPRHNLKRPTTKEVRRAEEAVESRVDLLRRIVQFNPMYGRKEAAHALDISDGAVKQLITEGQIGYVKIGTRLKITGWQLIEYIESISPTHKPTHNLPTDLGERRRTQANGMRRTNPLEVEGNAAGNGLQAKGL